MKESRQVIQEIIEKVVDFTMVAQIYQSIKNFRERQQTELIILISNKCTKALNELKPVLDMIFEAYPCHCYQLYYLQQAKEGIKKGNLFFHINCIATKLCYAHPDVDSNVFDEIEGYQYVVEKAKNTFIREITKIRSFNEGAQFYWDKQNYPLAAFMVHQQIEMAFRAIELFALGKDKVSHSIRIHQRHVALYLPELGTLLDENDEDQDRLLRQLDDAYLAVRYEDHYYISRDQLAIALEMGLMVQRKVEAVYAKMLALFGTQIPVIEC